MDEEDASRVVQEFILINLKRFFLPSAKKKLRNDKISINAAHQVFRTARRLCSVEGCPVTR